MTLDHDIVRPELQPHAVELVWYGVLLGGPNVKPAWLRAFDLDRGKLDDTLLSKLKQIDLIVQLVDDNVGLVVDRRADSGPQLFDH